MEFKTLRCFAASTVVCAERRTLNIERRTSNAGNADLGFFIPTGLRRKAQGCDAGATLGKPQNDFQPQRGLRPYRWNSFRGQRPLCLSVSAVILHPLSAMLFDAAKNSSLCVAITFFGNGWAGIYLTGWMPLFRSMLEPNLKCWQPGPCCCLH